MMRRWQLKKSTSVMIETTKYKELFNMHQISRSSGIIFRRDRESVWFDESAPTEGIGKDWGRVSIHTNAS
jgi:hypothetical protein